MKSRIQKGILTLCLLFLCGCAARQSYTVEQGENTFTIPQGWVQTSAGDDSMMLNREDSMFQSINITTLKEDKVESVPLKDYAEDFMENRMDDAFYDFSPADLWDADSFSFVSTVVANGAVYRANVYVKRELHDVVIVTYYRQVNAMKDCTLDFLQIVRSLSSM